ncbi:FHA domain-containing protein [Cryptosporangium minutisporangium]|uniref:FHA domain-containing protein n=1 Tax=Cryptosporangium minutisporangium TaxID=113569 RepID=UPI0031E8A89A
MPSAPSAVDAPPADASPADASPAGEWWVVVTADREYFERVRAMNGPDAGTVTFPLFCPERRFPLSGQQMLIGRRSRSRGIYPDIDLVGPPEDPAVSHTHALLLPQPDGRWSVIDLRSTNHTYVNGSTDPIDAEQPVVLTDGATVHVGAWTRLTLRAGSAT